MYRSIIANSFVLLSTVLLTAPGGCGSSKDSQGHDEEDLSQVPDDGEEGGRCGGIEGLPCQSGLLCKTPPGIADAFGTCVQQPEPGEEGGECGGIEGLPCQSGLLCKTPPGIA